MIIDKPLKIAFLFSMGFHSILFTPLLDFIGHPPRIENTDIQVTYIDIKEESFLKSSPPVLKNKTKPVPLKDTKVSLQKEEKPLSKDKKSQREDKIKEARSEEKPLQKTLTKEPSFIKEAIDLNSVYLKKGHSDSLNYLRAIRNRINLYVHRNYDPAMGEGEAFLHFILNSDGSVQSASIIKDNLKNKKRLRNLCLNSIYLSSPFKPFPKDLDLSQAAFNICISFKKK